MVSKDLIFTILGIDKASPAFDKVAKSAEATEDRLSSFGKVGAKAMAAFPVAAMGAGVATAGALTLIGAGVAGAAALILHNNEQITTAASDMWQDLKSGAQAAAAPMVGEITDALHTVHGAVRGLTPQFREMFSAAGPAIEHLSNGVVRFARNAMPGFVTAVKSGEPALRGMESFLADTGSGLTLFFTNLSKGAESSGQIMASTGRITRDALGFLGGLLAQISNSSAPAVATLEGFLKKLEDTVLSLGSGAFPALATSASGFLTVGSGLLSILGALAPILGPLVGHLGSFAVALKLVNMLSFGQVSTAFAGLKNTIGQADGAMGKMKAGASGLMSSGLLPLGVVAVGLGLVLTALGSSQQRAAKDAAAHESRVSSLTGALKESNGAINSNVKSLAAKSLSEQEVGRSGKTVLEVARESGVSLGTLTDAYLGNADAQKLVNAQLTAFIESRAAEGTAMDDVASRAYELREDVLPGLNTEYATSAQRARDLAAASGELAGKMFDLTPAQKAAKDEATKTKESFTTLADSFKGVAEKGQAVLDILDRMSGKQPDLREATQAWNDLVRTMTKDTDWNSTAAGVQKLTAGLVDMKGEVNTTTEAGSKLHDWAQQSAVVFATNGAAMKAAGVPADEMNKKLGVMRDQFIANAVAQGLPQEAAIRLADAYHLVPGQVSTLVLTPNLAQKMGEMGLFASQIRGLPNGSVVVTSNVDPARNSVTKLIQDINGKVATIRVTAVGTNREMVRNAAGGMPAAASGMKNSPGGWTLVGEEGPEIVDLPRGADVFDAVESARMMSGPSQSRSSSASSATSDTGTAPVVHKHYHLTYNAPPAGNVQDDFRRMEWLAGV